MEHATHTLSQRAGIEMHVMKLAGWRALRKVMFAACSTIFEAHDCPLSARRIRPPSIPMPSTYNRNC